LKVTSELTIETARLIHADCFEAISNMGGGSVHAIVTDPPYGVKEYEVDQLEKRAAGVGGIWRIPPSFDGAIRSPLPRFTALTGKEKRILAEYFVLWSKEITRVLAPGGHVFVASNAFLSQLVYTSIVDGGLEFRGEIIRLVSTLRGGDRPKNAEREFPDVCSMPRGNYEPWGLFRKPLPGKMTVADCLREYGAGALRRREDGLPFGDVIRSERSPKSEREIADHPSLKPQSFMRQIVRAALPLGTGVVMDPFMGSGSTIAAAIYNGYEAVGIERSAEYFNMAGCAIPRLAGLPAASKNGQVALNLSDLS
jgi:site-specific DNA-methyltransferase (adenine-specific)